jgi:hypothetical protein
MFFKSFCVALEVAQRARFSFLRPGWGRILEWLGSTRGGEVLLASLAAPAPWSLAPLLIILPSPRLPLHNLLTHVSLVSYRTPDLLRRHGPGARRDERVWPFDFRFRRHVPNQ